MSTALLSSPDCDRLFELAAAQAGHFTTRQAAEVGYSAQLLAHLAVVVPSGVVLHFGDVAAHERCCVGPVPVTTPSRARADCTAEHATPPRAPHTNEETA